MRKLLHLAFAIWKTDRPFDPAYDPRLASVDVATDAEATPACGPSVVITSDIPVSQTEQTAGLKPVVPALPEVTAARPETSDATAPRRAPVLEPMSIDFAHLKHQLPMSRVLDHLGLTPRLRGPGPQRRCACPIHRGDQRGRTFSVNTETNVFQCFEATCGAKGDVIDLWSRVKGMPLRDAAQDLVHTFHLEPCPGETEKRNG